MKMEILYKDETLDDNLEMYRDLTDMGSVGEELYIYDISDWRLLFVGKIPNEWYPEDLHNGDGFEYYFSDEAMIASRIKQSSIKLYMCVKYVQ